MKQTIFYLSDSLLSDGLSKRSVLNLEEAESDIYS